MNAVHKLSAVEESEMISSAYIRHFIGFEFKKTVSPAELR